MSESHRKPVDFEALATELRPKLHRYCARMAGSAIDGEDIVQDALVKAMQAPVGETSIADPEAWLFRIAHNTALDFLRRRVRLQAISAGELSEAIADPADAVSRNQFMGMGLRPFMKLSPAERSAVILTDIIGYSLRETGAIMNATLPATKAALHRGRTRLLSLAGGTPGDPDVVLTEGERDRLSHYVQRFNARDFEAVRDLLAEDVRLDLVNRMALKGKAEVSRYFTNYAAMSGWRLEVAAFEGRPAILLYRAGAETAKPANLILLEWAGGRISVIRDFHYAAYVLEAAASQ